MVYTLLMAIQSTLDLEPEEPRKGYEKIGRVTVIILIQKSSKLAQWFEQLEQISRMQSEHEQTLVQVL